MLPLLGHCPEPLLARVWQMRSSHLFDELIGAREEG